MHTTDRQRMFVSIHLGNEHGEFQPRLYAATPDQPIARIDVIDGLSIQTDDAGIFRRLATMLLNAADGIDEATAEAAVESGPVAVSA